MIHSTSISLDADDPVDVTLNAARDTEGGYRTSPSGQIHLGHHRDVILFVKSTAACDALIDVLLRAREHLALHEIVDAEIVEDVDTGSEGAQAVFDAEAAA